MDINFRLLVSIENGFEKLSKMVKFRYLHPAEARNHGYVWNIFHKIFEKRLFC